MESLKYSIIKSKKQYREYCSTLEELLGAKPAKHLQDEIELLTLLIEKWDDEHAGFEAPDPIALIKSLMEDHALKAGDLAGILGIGKSHVSEILNYRKGLSKVVIRKLSSHFKMSQDAFNRPYTLSSEIRGIAPRGDKREAA